MRANSGWLRASALGACAIQLVGLGSIAQAETIVSQRISATRRLVPLHKITVGPDDQYSGTASPDGKTLVFTHKSELVPHLCRQDLKTGTVNDLLPLTADSQEPSFSPEGWVAFSYYKYNARGDICYAEVPKDAKAVVQDGDIKCLKQAQGASDDRSNPFWKSATEIGYVAREVTSQATRIVVEDIKTGARQVLAEGKVFSPGMRAGGRYLFYSELVTTEGRGPAARVLALKDLASGQVRRIRLALPGISGFAAVSDDDRYVYFSHYLEDTNHDTAIDGSDNSVVFRAPIAALLALKDGAEYFPEQLTSLESNCSFPRPYGEGLYVSCALEGTLDIYTLPGTGVVPPAWDRAVLENVHRSSRTYAERVLLLNTIKFRGGPTGADSKALNERLLADHLLADDTSASRYYVKLLSQGAAGDGKNFFSLLGLYLDAREKKKSQPSKEVSREFQSQILAIDRQVEAVAGQPGLKSVVRGLLRAYIERPGEAKGFLRTERLGAPGVAPLESYLGFELAQWALPRTQSGAALAQAMTQAYSAMMRASELTEESRLFYAFNYLRYLHEVENGGETADKHSRQRRIERISALAKTPGLPEFVQQLLQSEVASLNIILAPDDAAKLKAYAPLDQLMSKSRDDFYLRRALYVRAIINFTEGAEFKFMNFVASNWLRFTQMADAEFIRAREIFNEASLDRAYENWGKKNYLLADNFFYGSLSLTDDLESHAGYIRAMVTRGERKTLDERYANLKDRGFVEDNLKFVEALLILMDYEALGAKAPESADHLDAMLSKLLAMEHERDSAVRYLMLGYCYLEKLLRTASGYEIDETLFQNAHRNLMLAYDLGRDNTRIRASVLMDLGILHARAQNHGLAARFFDLREELGFVSSVEEGSFAWLYARSLYYSHQPDEAADALADSPGDVPIAYVGPLIEREAFYRVAAGDFEEAVALYQKLLKGGHIRGDANLAKVHLSYGWGLFGLKGRDKEARRELMQALSHAEKLERIPRGKSRSVDFEPVRIQLAAYGLLGRFGTDIERLEALSQRARLLPQAKKLFDTSYLPTVIQNLHQRAAIVGKGQPAQALPLLKEAVGLAHELVELDQALSIAVYRAASGYLSHAWLNPGPYAREDASQVGKLIELTLQAYGKQRGVQPLLVYQRVKLQMLWAAYQAKVVRGSPQAAAAELEQLASADDVQALRESMPKQYAELGALKALGR